MRYEHGGDIYTNEYRLDFSSNINPFGMSEDVRLAAANSMKQASAYPDSRCRRFKSALAEKLGISEKWIIAGNGAADLIFSLVFAVRPKRGLILAPAFLEYEQALKSADCRTVVYERPKELDFTVDKRFIKVLEAELKQGLDLVFLCSPDNPTGGLIRKDILEEALKLCDRYGSLLVMDESFYEFAFAGESETMLPKIEETKSLVIIRSFTKMYGMPGLRLGYGISSDSRLIERMEMVRQPWSVSIPAQEAGIAALKAEGWTELVRNYVKKQRVWLQEQLTELGFRVYPSSANYLLFYTDRKLMEPLKEQGILIRDCSNYRGLADGYYRVAVKKEEENEELIRALCEICSENG